MRRATASFIAATTSIAALALCSAAHAEGEADGPTAVPYRPSVSTPAALSAPGWLEVEAGLLHQHAGEGERRDSLPVTLKLAFTPDWGVRVGTDAWVRSRAAGDGRRESGYGDTAIVLKRRFAVDEAQAFGLEAGAVLATARRRDLGSGSGKADYGLNAIYSADFGDGWHTDINLAGTRLGAVDADADAGASRLQWLGAAALSRALSERWGLVAELSGTAQRGADSSRQLLMAASYNASKRLVLDAGAARSLRPGAPAWSAFAGFTWTAGRVF